MVKIASTKNIYLRELTFADWEAVHEYASDLEVVRYQAWGPHTEKDSKEWVNLSIVARQKVPREMYYFGICESASDRLVGGVGIHTLSENQGTFEIGYSVNRHFWRRGYGSEAVRESVAFIFNDRSDIQRLVAHCRDCNEGSIKLLERLRFKREGHHLNDVKVRGQLMNSYWYGLLREEFDTHRCR